MASGTDPHFPISTFSTYILQCFQCFLPYGTEMIQKTILQIFENWAFIQERILLKRGISFSSKH